MVPIEVKQNSCWAPVRVLNYLPTPTNLAPHPCDCSASRSGGCQECELTNNRYFTIWRIFCRQVWDCRKLEASDHGVRLLNSAIIGVLSGSGVKLTPEPGGFEN